MNLSEYRQIMAAKKKGNKYRAKPVTDSQGRYHASTKEYNEYQNQIARLKAGVIIELKCQITYRLEVNGVYVTRYRADFVCTLPDNTIEVIDVKGLRKGYEYTRFRMKKALMLAVYGITIIEK